jgi:hypothetical protein
VEGGAAVHEPPNLPGEAAINLFSAGEDCAKIAQKLG